jgi:membrane protease YdiL (CAAX protease family)
VFTPSGFKEYILSLPIDQRILLLLPPNLLLGLVMIPLGLLRLGRGRLRKLNLGAPSLTQLLILLAAVYPTSIVATPLFEAANSAWIEICKGHPALEAFNEDANLMETLAQFQGGSLLLLFLFLAVAPAVGEEFVFRGVVGRGLVARWGLWPGILLTSLMFAVVHGYPPHIVAVFPIGVMMHIVYLTTRSLWAPMLFHFANNGMGAVQVALAAETDAEGEVVWWRVAMACGYLALSVVLLYRFRTRYVNDDGEEISPGYITVAAPPAEAGARRHAPTGWIIAPLIGLVLAGTLYYVASDLAQSTTPAADKTESAEAQPVLEPDPRRIEITLTRAGQPPCSAHRRNDGRIIA